jgi:hypothetical protein
MSVRYSVKSDVIRDINEAMPREDIILFEVVLTSLLEEMNILVDSVTFHGDTLTVKEKDG